MEMTTDPLYSLVAVDATMVGECRKDLDAVLFASRFEGVTVEREGKDAYRIRCIPWTHPCRGYVRFNGRLCRVAHRRADRPSGNGRGPVPWPVA